MLTKTSKLYLRFLFALCICIFHGSNAQALTIWLQSQIDNFAIDHPNVTTLNESIWIKEANPGTITNLNGLIQLKRIKGYLRISENKTLLNLSGLDSLSQVDEELSILDNEQLISIEALSQVNYVKRLNIYLNRALKNLKGLERIQIIESSVTIVDNDKLESLQGLNNLRYIELYLSINDNLILRNMEGLNQLKVVGDEFNIWNNKALESLNGLDQLQTISNELTIQANPRLTSLKALSNLINLGGNLIIDLNISLESLSGLENLKSTLLTGIQIANCNRLSNCAFNGICDYLNGEATPVINLYNNECGCDNIFELENACERFRNEAVNTDCKLLIYPNPVNNSILIKKKSVHQIIKRIEIIDNIGKVLLRSDRNENFLNVNKLPRGTYNIRIMIDDEVETLRFLKK